MQKAIVVIGANFGDEGKGATVAKVCNEKAIKDVIRFNGGSQAGHTVTVNGVRHVHQNFGSGTLLGRNTWYTKDVLVNPHYAWSERNDLVDKGIHPNLIRVHPECPVVSPWDIALNQVKEMGRGDKRHGSVGYGIGETVARLLNKQAPGLHTEDLMNDSYLVSFTGEIQGYYLNQIRKLHLEGGLNDFLNPDPLGYWTSDRVLSKALTEFLKYPYAFMKTMRLGETRGTIVSSGSDEIKNTNVFFPTSELVVFEGAQGLLLDQNRGEYFPHLTRSNTGLQNVVKTCDEEGCDIEEVLYVTRPYITRHGAGPVLAKDGVECDDYWTLGQDRTNVPGKYQGTIRYAHLDWAGLRKRISQDLQYLGTKYRPRVKVMVSCTDQISNQAVYQMLVDGKFIDFDATRVGEILANVETILGYEVQAFDGRGIGNLASSRKG